MQTPAEIELPSILPANFDWKNPAYEEIAGRRVRRMRALRAAGPGAWEQLERAYAEDCISFIKDWGWTHDPRNAEVGLPTTFPFALFPKQEEFIAWLYERWTGREDGLVEKSRDSGATWLCVAFSVWMWKYRPGSIVGFGSRKEEYVDQIGDPKSIFWKIRRFIALLPKELRPRGYDEKRHAPFMRILNPLTDSAIVGEAGDNIGRGNRTSIYFVDESAFVEHGESVESALSETSNCKIHVSTPNEPGDLFHRKRLSRRYPVFTFHWAQPLDASVLTPNGWRQMGELAVGDSVIGADGKPTVVTGVYPQGEKEIYRVRFSDGAETECCADHLWSVVPSGNQRAKRKHIRRVMALREMMEDYVTLDPRGYKRHRYQVPITESVEFAPQRLPLDPYVLGCLLGDGSLPKDSSRPIVLCTEDAEIAALMGARLPAGCRMSAAESRIQYRVVADASHRGGSKGRGWHNPVSEAIRELGLAGTQSHDKFVPDPYKFGSRAERLDVLRGLMDTDGTAALKSHPGVARLVTVSKRLADDAAFIAQTLGGVARVHKRPAARREFPGGRTCDCRENYQVDVKLPAGLVPFLLGRKVAAYRPAVMYGVRRSVVGIERAGVKPAQCIKVAAEDGLYLTDHCIVTHNSDDPRKGPDWYARKVATLDPSIVAREIDINYEASITNAHFPADKIVAAMAKGPADVTALGKWTISVDVARFGPNETVITCRRGRLVLPQIIMAKSDTQDVAGKVKETVTARGGIENVDQIAVDDIGLGGGVTDQLRRWYPKKKIKAVIASTRVEDGINFNLRAKMYWEALQWVKDEPNALPNDPEFKVQLSSIKYRYKGGLRLICSKKEEETKDMAESASGSPDRADSFALGFAFPPELDDYKPPVIAAPVPFDRTVGY